MTMTPTSSSLSAVGLRLLVGWALLSSSALPAIAQTPSPSQMLDSTFAPKHDDAVLGTPSPDERKLCTVEHIKGGYVVRDPNGRLLRRFLDTNSDGKFDVWSYYKDGVETYREFDTTYKTGRPNNFRWLNEGGMKWGTGSLNANGKASIDTWRMISAEEAGYEAFQAVATRNYDRLRALLITDAELQSLQLSATTLKRINQARQNAPTKFHQLTSTLNLQSARFQRVEGITPRCVLDDGEHVVIKYASRPILYEINKKHDWLHTGEMIQVGMTWRLVDGPSTQEVAVDQPPVRPSQKLFEELTRLDESPPQVLLKSKNAKVDAYLRKRIGLIQQIIPLEDANTQLTWYKGLFDNLSSLAQNSGAEADLKLIKQWKDEVVSKRPGSNVAAYATYRELWTRYALAMTSTDTKQIAAIQERWLEKLTDFVKQYPRAEDTPEALHQLGVGCEFDNKEDKAKAWYAQLIDNFPNHNLAPRARGSYARLNLQGKELQLRGPLLYEPNKVYDITQHRGKAVIVYYWASYSSNFDVDFIRLKRVLDANPKRGVELVCINLDDRADVARDALKKVSGQWVHLYQAPPNNTGSGMYSPLAIQYGIHMLPTMFLVGRDGRVIHRSLQIGELEAELKKLK